MEDQRNGHLLQPVHAADVSNALEADEPTSSWMCACYCSRQHSRSELILQSDALFEQEIVFYSLKDALTNK